jgi:hypothetical protein
MVWLPRTDKDKNGLRIPGTERLYPVSHYDALLINFDRPRVVRRHDQLYFGSHIAYLEFAMSNMFAMVKAQYNDESVFYHALYDMMDAEYYCKPGKDFWRDNMFDTVWRAFYSTNQPFMKECLFAVAYLNDECYRRVRDMLKRAGYNSAADCSFILACHKLGYDIQPGCTRYDIVRALEAIWLERVSKRAHIPNGKVKSVAEYDNWKRNGYNFLEQRQVDERILENAYFGNIEDVIANHWAYGDYIQTGRVFIYRYEAGIMPDEGDTFHTWDKYKQVALAKEWWARDISIDDLLDRANANYYWFSHGASVPMKHTLIEIFRAYELEIQWANYINQDDEDGSKGELDYQYPRMEDSDFVHPLYTSYLDPPQPGFDEPKSSIGGQASASFPMDRFDELEKEHMGDFEKGTGIYNPDLIALQKQVFDAVPVIKPTDVEHVWISLSGKYYWSDETSALSEPYATKEAAVEALNAYVEWLNEVPF